MSDQVGPSRVTSAENQSMQRSMGASGEVMQDLGVGVFQTPRSSGSLLSGPGVQRQAHSGKWPGWVSRLGEMFKAPTVQWLPSPLPSPPKLRAAGETTSRTMMAQAMSTGAPAATGPWQGMASDETRGIGGVSHNQHYTPSSSSIPAEAIQAEVQRQLGSLLERLQQTEAENFRLQDQLLRAQAAQARWTTAQGVPRGESSQGVPELHEGLGGICEELPQGAPAVDSGVFPVHRGDPYSREQGRPNPWRDPLGALWDELTAGRSSSSGPQRTQGAIRPEAEGQQVSETSSTNAILEALTKNLAGLQALQEKSLKKDLDVDDTPEQVKSTTIALPKLSNPEGATMGVVLQDWLAQVAVPMQDLSASSGTWWAQVLELVQTTYATWLAASPLERLQLEPKDHSALTTGKWTRVNARACSLSAFRRPSRLTLFREGWFKALHWFSSGYTQHINLEGRRSDLRCWATYRMPLSLRRWRNV